METSLDEEQVRLHESIERLRNGVATDEDARDIREYLGVVQEMLALFDTSFKKVQEENTV